MIGDEISAVMMAGICFFLIGGIVGIIYHYENVTVARIGAFQWALGLGLILIDLFR